MKKSLSTILGIVLVLSIVYGKYHLDKAEREQELIDLGKFNDELAEKALSPTIDKPLLNNIASESNEVEPVEEEPTQESTSFTDEDITSAIISGDTKTLTQYLDNGLSPDYILQGTSTEYLLILAIADRENAIVRLLLEYDANPNILAMDGNITPLMGATISRNKEAIELLLDAGADKALSGEIKGTPLEMAIAKGYDELVPLLR
jgi:hypothetical protein